MTDPSKSLRLLCDGFKENFAEVVMQDERFVEALMHISTEFVDNNIPIVDEDSRQELCLMLMDTIGVRTL